jgi:hypothetical protein
MLFTVFRVELMELEIMATRVHRFPMMMLLVSIGKGPFLFFSIIPQLKEKSKGILLYMGEGNGLRLFVILGLSVYNGKPVCYTENEVKKK